MTRSRRALVAMGLVGLVAIGACAARPSMGVGAALLFVHPPDAPFEAVPAPPAPDYADPRAWAARPDVTDASDVAPPGLAMADPKATLVDAFFVHPTTFFSGDAYNASIDDASTNARTDAGPLRGQASAWNACCAVWAPRYRQFTFGVVKRYDASARAAEDLAYSDVKRAFERFASVESRGRPFVLAGHSQGSRHLARLLKEVVDGTPLASRLVAAYVVGTLIPERTIAAFETIRACEGPTDTRCVVSWSTVGEGADPAAQRAAFAARSGWPAGAAGETFLCTNPISWRRNGGAAPAVDNLGGWLPRRDLGRPIDAAVVGARCADGYVVVDEPPWAYRAIAMPGENYHTADVQLFWVSLRKNTLDRAAAFLAKR